MGQLGPESELPSRARPMGRFRQLQQPQRPEAILAHQQKKLKAYLSSTAN